MVELSVIIPFVNEWPLISATIRNVSEELRDRVDFEVIAVDNYTRENQEAGYTPDRGHTHYTHKDHRDKRWSEYEKVPVGAERHDGHIASMASKHDWLTCLRYDDKLSHWQAKNLAVQRSAGRFLLFIDAHCQVSRDSIINQLNMYKKMSYDDCTLHLPLTYHLLESKMLIYRLLNELEKGIIEYRFSGYRDEQEPYEVPCMSTCGMMISRHLYDELGGWPVELGIYSGGEHFINFTMAVLGKGKFIMPGPPLFHHGDKRGYSYRYDDMIRNRLIATYMFGGLKLADLHAKNMKGDQGFIRTMLEGIKDKCNFQRYNIQMKQVMSIQEWAEIWTNKKT